MLPKAWTQEQRCSNCLLISDRPAEMGFRDHPITISHLHCTPAVPKLSPQSCPHATMAARTRDYRHI